jgi:signal transduction histidine kinase
MSHELRTPLNAILGFAQVLELDQLADEQRDSLGHILSGAQHLLGLINEVLDIATHIVARQPRVGGELAAQHAHVDGG